MSAAICSATACAAVGVVAGVFDQHADARRQVGRALVQVGLDVAVEVRDPAQFELLADLGGQLGDHLLDGLVTDLGGFEGVDVGRFGRGRSADDLIGDLLELRVLGDEVGLAVQLDQRAVLGRDQALGGGPLGTLAHVLGALDAQRLDGLVEVAVALGQRVLAVEHAGAGQLTKTLDVGSGEVRPSQPFLGRVRG